MDASLRNFIQNNEESHELMNFISKNGGNYTNFRVTSMAEYVKI
jgi:hypothetical protein